MNNIIKEFRKICGQILLCVSFFVVCARRKNVECLCVLDVEKLSATQQPPPSQYNMHSHSNSTYTANIEHIRMNEDIDNDVKQVK